MKPGEKNEFPYTPARLVPNEKRPYIVYYAWDVNAKKLKRCRYFLRQSTEEARAAEAKRYIKEINQQLKAGWHIDDSRPKEEIPEPLPVVEATAELSAQTTVYQAFEFYKRVKSRDLRTKTTVELYSDYANLLFRFLLKKEGRNPDAVPMPIPTTRLVKITPGLANEFFDSLTQGGRFRNNLLGWLKSFFKFFDQDHRGLIIKNPFARLETVPVDESDVHRPYSQAQATQIREAILAKGDAQLWRFVEFAYYLFIRPGNELRLLRVGDLLEKRVRIVSVHGKNRKVGYVDISVGLERTIQADKLRDYPANYYLFTRAGQPGPEPCGQNYFYKRHAEILKTVGLYGLDYDLYSWKPTGAIALYRHTKDILRVQRHCRHASPDQTYTYLRKHDVIFAGQDLTDFPAGWDEN